jgi:oxygen-independent coproporphyrinogen-3 oxidase
MDGPEQTRVTAELLARHDRPGPRYTSYPTAPQFHTDFGPEAYADRLAEADRHPSDPLAMYVHLPFCEHRCLYCGCHVVVTRREDVVRRYLDYLKLEIDRLAEALPNRREISQLHWGGGTPTRFSPAQMRELFGALKNRFVLQPDAEVAIEIDPRVTTEAHLEVLRELGFNRISLGVQDFTPEVQEAIGRHQTLEQTERLLQSCRSLGFCDFNVDLIYGLPRQTVETFRSGVAEVIRLRPDRVAVYSYAHVPWMRPHQRRIDESTLPTTEAKIALFATAIDCFLDAGYAQIGMDHFALPDNELARAQGSGALTRNFMGYTVKTAPDLLALGVSGIGDVAGAFAQNEKKLATYYRALDEGKFPIERGYVLDPDDRIRRFVIQSLMCNFELDPQVLHDRFDVRFGEYFEAEQLELQHSVEPSFYELEDGTIRITPAGRPFVRNVCMAFDRYLKGDSDRALYSRTV